MCMVHKKSRLIVYWKTTNCIVRYVTLTTEIAQYIILWPNSVLSINHVRSHQSHMRKIILLILTDIILISVFFVVNVSKFASMSRWTRRCSLIGTVNNLVVYGIMMFRLISHPVSVAVNVCQFVHVKN